jgi:hypothetical protein
MIPLPLTQIKKIVSLTIRVCDRDDCSMRVTPHQLRTISGKELTALRQGWAHVTQLQAEHWCLIHVGDDWYSLPLMLMAKGYGEDYENFTEVGADSVYELDESGCYIAFPEWWTAFELWRRDGVLKQQCPACGGIDSVLKGTKSLCKQCWVPMQLWKRAG